jgi:nitrate/nitrite transporter NarK
MTFGLLTRFGGARSAVAAMVTSIVVQVGGTWLWHTAAPMTVSCLVSLAVYVAVALWERRTPQARLV